MSNAEKLSSHYITNLPVSLTCFPFSPSENMQNHESTLPFFKSTTLLLIISYVHHLREDILQHF